MTCPVCGGTLALEQANWGLVVMACQCGYVTPAHRAACQTARTAAEPPRMPGDAPKDTRVCRNTSRDFSRALKLPGLDRGRQSVRVRETEADLQAAIVQALTLLTYVVLQTSEHRRGQTCPQCGAWQVLAGGRGTSKAIPDLLITRAGWRHFVGLEVKGPRTPVSPEQAALADAGHIVIVRSVEQALEAVENARGDQADELQDVSELSAADTRRV